MGLPILLTKAKILLIGGGNVALQKARVLHENNIDFTTISTFFHKEIFTYLNDYHKKDFTIRDTKGFDYIINATGDENITHQLLEEKKKRFFLLNIVDKPELCDFYFQSLLNIGKLQISISTNGASPIISKLVKEKIKNTIPKKLENLINDSYEERKLGIINKNKIHSDTTKLLNKINFIKCKKNNLNNLTIKAYQTIQTLQIAIIDKDLDEQIKQIIPKNCEIIEIDKIKNIKSFYLNILNDLKVIGRITIKNTKDEINLLKSINITNIKKI